MLFSCKQLMEQKIYKIIFATLVTFVQILVSEMIFRLVFGSSTFGEHLEQLEQMRFFFL